MIEQYMYFALGALCAGLLSLTILPAFWRRAERLVRRDLERKLPLSPKEIAAERDQLRAGFAVRQRQIEQRLEAANTARGEDLAVTGTKMVQISKLSDEIVGLNQTIAQITGQSNAHEAHATALAEELASVNATLSANQSTLAHEINQYLELEQQHQALTKLAADQAIEISGLNAFSASLDQRALASEQGHAQTLKNFDAHLALHADLQGAWQRMSELADERRLEISNLQTELELARGRVEEQQGQIANLRQQIQARTTELTGLNRDLSTAGNQTIMLQSRLDAALQLAARRQETIESKNDTLQIKNSALSDTSSQMAMLRAELTAEIQARKRIERESASALKKLNDMEQNLIRTRQQSQETARDLSRTIELLRSEKTPSAVSVTRQKTAAASAEPEKIPGTLVK